jgi:hypothetical protein
MKRVIPRNCEHAAVRQDDHWGEMAIHFPKGSALLLSITRTERETLLAALRRDDTFFHVFSMSNQIVAVRRAAITDLYLASEESGTYGPEHESYDVRAIWQPRPNFFWEVFDELVVQELALDDVESRYGKETVAEVQHSIRLEVDRDVNTHIQSCVRDASDIESSLAKQRDDLMSLASTLIWQLSTGKTRQTLARACDLTQYSWMYDRCDPPRLMISVHGDDAEQIFINGENLDYLSIPEHLFSHRI